ncbi:hypothetical protein BH11CYA1_BH11CYA1_11070 [soil metagenome]
MSTKSNDDHVEDDAEAVEALPLAPDPPIAEPGTPVSSISVSSTPETATPQSVTLKPSNLYVGPSASWSLFAAAVLTCCFLISGPSLYWGSHPLLTNPDSAIYLDIAMQLLDGKVPYADIFEWNPPLIMYMNIVPVLIGRVFTLPVILCFNLLLLAGCLWSSIFSLVIARKYMSNRDFAAFIPVVLVTILFTAQQSVNMGEREHMFVILYLPLFILRYLRWQGVPLKKFEAILAGLGAGLGLALKPQFVFCAVMADLVMLLQRAAGVSIKKCLGNAEVVSAIIPGLFHILLILTLPGEAWNVLLNQVLPLYKYGLPFSRRSLMFMLKGHPAFSEQYVHFIAAAVLVFCFGRYKSWLWALLAFMSAAQANYLLGDQAWALRMIPMDFAAYLVFGTVIGLFFNLFGANERSRLAICGMIAGVMIMTGWGATVAYSGYEQWKLTTEDKSLYDMAPLGYKGTCHRDELGELFFVIVSNTMPKDKVLFIGTGIHPGYPSILQSGRLCASRYIFSIPALIEYCEKTYPKVRPWNELMQEVLSNYEKDIELYRPRLIIMETEPFTTIFHKQGFYQRIFSNYIHYGKIAEGEVYIRKANSGLAVTDAYMRANGVKARIIDVVLGRRKAAQVAAELRMDESQVELLAKKASVAVDEAFKKNLSENQAEMQLTIRRLDEEIRVLKRKNLDLTLEIERLQKVQP